MASMGPVPLHLKVDESDLVIIGIVSNTRLLSGVAERCEISSNSFSVAFPIEGMIYQIKVEKILLDKRKAKGNRDGKLSDVSAFVSAPFTNASPVCEKGERHLMFLEQADIEPRIVTRHQLKKKDTYEFVFSREGTY